MSRIQDILSKAERDGTARRTRAVADEYSAPPSDEGLHARGFGDATAPARPAPARGPTWIPTPGERGRPAPVLPRTGRGDAPASAPALRPLTPAPGTTGDEATETATPQVVGNLDPLLVAAVAPTSLAAEQYRSLRTRIKRAGSGRSLRTIAITSPAKGDGKSLTAANLALTMAQEFQERVLLVDADLRRPAVHRLFGIAEDPGLTDVLMGLAELEQSIVTLPEHYLAVLPAGTPPSHPAELLGSAAMRRVMEAARARFDRILIDVPPVAPLADLHVLAPQVDGLLMIVRAGVTPKPAIEHAFAGLDASKVLGIVLNEAGDGRTGGDAYEGYGYIAG